MNRIFSIVTLLAVMTMSAPAMAGKVGFVNVNLLFNEYAKVKGIDKMIEDNYSGRNDELVQLRSDIMELEKEIKTNELLMSESKLEKSKNKLKDMALEYREKGMQLDKELKEVRNREMGEFKKVVFEVTQKYGNENKFDLIINEGVMFASESVNVTNDILKLVTNKIK